MLVRGRSAIAAWSKASWFGHADRGAEIGQGGQIVRELLSEASELRELIFDGGSLTAVLADILKCAPSVCRLCAEGRLCSVCGVC